MHILTSTIAITSRELLVLFFVIIFTIAPLDPCNYNEAGERGNRNNAIVMPSLLAPLRSPAPSLRAPAFERGMVVWPTDFVLLPRTPFASGQKDPNSPNCPLTRAAGGTGLLR